MPAAAVIPAELEMDNIVAVKTYVVTSVLVHAFKAPGYEHLALSNSAHSASKLERLT